MSERDINESHESHGVQESRTRILVIDDEESFRIGLKNFLEHRGYHVTALEDGRDAVRIVRHQDISVVLLDVNLTDADPVQTLNEIKHVRPDVQVIMLMSQQCSDFAQISGRNDVFRFLPKPCGMRDLVSIIEEALQARWNALARHEVPMLKRDTIWQWLAGVRTMRPGMILLGLLVFALIAWAPTPRNLIQIVDTPKTGDPARDAMLMGYAEYEDMALGETVAEHYSGKAKLTDKIQGPGGRLHRPPLPAGKIAFRAKIMVATLALCAILWATGALPFGITAFLAAIIMYLFGVLPPDMIAKAHAKDAVLFIIGVLALARAIGKTGLDRRLGLLLLGTSRSFPRFLFIFGPMLAITASFLSEHALVAFIVPVLLLAYRGVVREAGVKQDRALLVAMLLTTCFCANLGGPGSPAAGGRNAIMVGIMADYGISISFMEWVKYGLPFVPVAALAVAGYMYVMFRGKIKVKHVDLSRQVREQAAKIGRMTREEYITAAVLAVLMIVLVFSGEQFGLGGPFLMAVVALNIAGVLQWRDVNGIHWDVVALYASASAMGTTLAFTGGSLWIADTFLNVLPAAMRAGTGLAVSTSLFTGFLTNIMSDGATVAAIGPITVPMATLSGTSAVKVGLATAFSSSFANMLIIGTPNNALVYAMGKDPETGEQLLTVLDFLKHGFATLVISLVVLWGWAFFGYWNLLTF